MIKIKTQGNWILVADQDGEKHWVYRGYVSNKVKCLSIKFARAELRKKPSFRSEFSDYRYAEKYESFERIKAQGKWYFVRNLEGGEGWLHRDQVWRAVKKISLKY